MQGRLFLGIIHLKAFIDKGNIMNLTKAKKKILSTILAATIATTTITPVDLQAKEQINEVVNLEAEKQSVNTILEDRRKYIEDELEITFQISSQWKGAFQAEVLVHNTSSQPIENWAFKFDLEHAITNIWNGEIHKQGKGYYIIKNADYNQKIASGQSIRFGFTAQADGDIIFPEEFQLVSEEEKIEDSQYTLQWNVIHKWDSSFNGEFIIQNHSKEMIEGWKAEFDYAGTIHTFWQADILEHTGNHYVIANRGYNSKIARGGTLALGFQASAQDESIKPENVVLHHVTIRETEFVNVEGGTLEKEYYRTIQRYLYRKGIPADSIKMTDDYDKDGLDVKEEYENDTDPFSADTDEDGLNDREELYIYKTDPLLFDTDDDSMSDGTEIKCGLNPLHMLKNMKR